MRWVPLSGGPGRVGTVLARGEHNLRFGTNTEAPVTLRNICGIVNGWSFCIGLRRLRRIRRLRRKGVGRRLRGHANLVLQGIRSPGCGALMLSLGERRLPGVWLHGWAERSARLRMLRRIWVRAAVGTGRSRRHGMGVVWVALLAWSELRIGLRWTVLLLLLLMLLQLLLWVVVLWLCLGRKGILAARKLLLRRVQRHGRRGQRWI